MAGSARVIRVDENVRREAVEVARYYGLDLSSVTRALCKQMTNTHRILLTFAPRGAERRERGCHRREKPLPRLGSPRPFLQRRRAH